MTAAPQAILEGVPVAPSRPAPSHALAAHAKAAKSRELGVDAARIVACIIIVWQHAPTTDTLLTLHSYGTFATAFFVSVSVYFLTLGLKRKPDRSLGDVIRVRFKRLYVPFLAWSAIYLAVRNTSRIFFERKPLVLPSWQMLLSGGECHLWFLPFIMGAAILAYFVIRAALASDGKHRHPIVLLLAVAGLVAALAPPPAFAPERDTVNFWRAAWWGTPAAFWGIAIALSDELVARLREKPTNSVMLLALLWATCMWATYVAGPTIWAKNLAGISCLLAALSIPAPRPGSAIARMASLAPLGFGIYLTHILPIGFFHAAISKAHLQPTVWLDVIQLALAVTAATLLARMIRSTRGLRWLIPQ